MQMKLFNTYTTDKYNIMLFASMVASVLAALADSADYILAGIYFGAEGTKVANMITPISQISVFFSYLIVIGVAIIYSERMGAFDKKGADSIFTMGLISAVVMGLLFAGIMQAGGKTYLGIYSIEPDMYDSVLMYYRLMVISMAFKPLFVLFYTMLFIDGDSGLAALSVIVCLTGKIVFSVVFAGSYGIAGLGLASVICMLLTLAVELIHLFKKTSSLHLSTRPDFRSLPHALKFSLIDAAVYLYSAILVMVLNLIMQNRFGGAALLIASAVNFVRGWYRITDGIGTTMEPFVNTYHGQRSYDGVKKIFKNSMTWAAILGSALCIAFCFAANTLTAYLGITDPEMAGICITGIRIVAIGFLINAFTYCLTSYYLYIERVALGFIITAFNDFILLLPGIFICMQLFGIMGVFIAFPAVALLTLILSLLIIRIIYGKEKSPTLLVHEDDITDDVVYQYEIEDNSIQQLKEHVEKFLTGLGYDTKAVLTSLFILEEMSFYIKEVNNCSNSDRETGEAYRHNIIKAECAVIAGDNITIVLCDNGKLIDMSDIERDISSLRSYVITMYINKKLRHVRNLMTMGNNRCSFEVPVQPE